MPTLLGSLRRLALTPSLAEVTFGHRGFPGIATPATRRLEAIPQAVICGFEWGIDARSQWEVERRLELVDAEQRGFAYEGATMAFTVLDAMGPRKGTKARDLMLGPGQPHIFLTYIGIGFAMSHLPRPLWRKVLPDLSGSPYFPTMSWLAVDGYGFDLAYFHTDKWVTQQRVPKPYPWLGRADYFPRAIDQGIGRALWFINGGRAMDAAAAVDRFAEHRRADLWGGVGLAATFAGGSDADGLAALHAAAGEYQPELGQGAIFAAKARVWSGHLPAHTEAACLALAGVNVAEADAIADSTAVDPDALGPDGEPAYEVWRANIRTALRSRLTAVA